MRDALIEETGKESQPNSFLLHTPGSAFLILQKFMKQLSGLCFLFVVAVLILLPPGSGGKKEVIMIIIIVVIQTVGEFGNSNV